MDTAQKLWDVIIVGGGPAGSNAAIVLARCYRSVLLIDEGRQRNIRSHGMHNYLSRDGMLPSDFLQIAGTELERYGVQRIHSRITHACRLGDFHFRLTEASGQVHEGRRLLLATGVTDLRPELPGIEALWGKHVFHCPYCDGWECSDLQIGIYAKNKNGYGMALAMQQFSPHITLFTDGARYLKTIQRQQLKRQNIRVVTQPLKALEQESGKLSGIRLQDDSLLPCEALFVNHGIRVNNELALQLGARCTRKGIAVVNRHQQCSVPGVYVAGDAALDAHFVVVAAAEGSKAAISIHEDLLRHDHLAALAVKDVGAPGA